MLIFSTNKNTQYFVRSRIVAIKTLSTKKSFWKSYFIIFKNKRLNKKARC